jgi:ABC-type sugar transport system ATPase subunit
MNAGATATAYGAPERSTASGAPVLEARAIAKHYDGIFALNGAELAISPGEIHALLGENGAGKSTLIKILTGAETADSGEVFIDGRAVALTSPSDALDQGIVALYQELSIIPGLSVAENISIGNRMPSRMGFVDFKSRATTARHLLDRLGQQDVAVTAIASSLSPVKQTMVSIARAIASEAKVLFLDEPTASLTNREIEDLFKVLRSLRDEGVAIVYVSHRLDEVFELCDHATILRGGSLVHTGPITDMSIDDVITAMAGIRREHLFPDRAQQVGPTTVRIAGLSGRRVHDVSLTIGRGEILGVGGLAGSGRSELLRLIGGAQRAAAGAIMVDGVSASSSSVGNALDHGIALVPEERRTQGLVLDQSVSQNTAMASFGTLARGGWYDRSRAAALVRESVERFRIKIASPAQPVGQLSGGNQQKVLLAKFLARNPKLLLLDEPTRGIDVGTKAEIYNIIRELAGAGMSILLVSSELPELLGLADRIIIMHEGQVAGTVRAEDADEELLLNYFYGRTTNEHH